MDTSPPKRLYRSKTNRILGGVCGGLGDYFSIDPTLLRVAFVVLCFGGGFGLVAYLILWIIVPEQGQEHQTPEQRAQAAGQEMQATAQKLSDDVRHDHGNGRLVVAILLIGFGIMAFGRMFFPWSWWRWDFFWPLIIVAIGVSIILKRK